MPELVLGLDTGGTNTDAVLFDPLSRTVLDSAKAFTTHHNLAIGISGALKGLSAKPEAKKLWPHIKSVNLSTTLATNAIAEGVSNRVGLIMIGFDRDQNIVQELIEKLPSVEHILIDGGHDFYGQEEMPLDETALLEGIEPFSHTVAAWAVAGYFSIKNPSHEIRAAELIRQKYPQPVTLGQNLTGQLGAVKRAATAALNAGLVIIINRLLDAVKQTMNEIGLIIPLMVVKGDGGLVSELWARERPIETVVSGPAASLVGTRILARGYLSPEEKDLWVLDVGGTTSDLAYLKDGQPLIDINGSKVGEWVTMVEAVKTATRGLGGDSIIDLGPEKKIIIGPRRVLPLCRLSQQWPNLISILLRHKRMDLTMDSAGRFFLPNLPPGPDMNRDEEMINELLKKRNPLAVADYTRECLEDGRLFAGLKILNHPSILVSAFTPTDAMSVLGLFSEGDRKASIIGAEIIGQFVELDPEELSRNILNEFGRLLAEEILKMALEQEKIKFKDDDFDKDGLLDKALYGRSGHSLTFSIRLKEPVALLGAPAAILAPWAEKFTRARILVPPNFNVASSVGAAASTVTLTRRIEIGVLPNFTGYRAYLPDRIMDHPRLTDLVLKTAEYMENYMRHLITQAGGDENSTISYTRADRATNMNDGSHLVMGSSLIFTTESPSEKIKRQTS